MADGAPGPALLVPMTVEALVVTYAEEGLWAWTPPDYGFLTRFQPPAPGPGSSDRPAISGAVLHWALPDGLTHGRHDGDRIVYPHVPNRYLVVRKSPTVEGTAWSYRSWIVASDYVGGPAGSSYPDPAGVGAISLGASWPLEQWPGEQALRAKALSTPLTAVGPGDPTFAAFVPNVQNVFSLADPLDDAPLGPLSYAVYGWYAPPAQDPLAGCKTAADWASLLATLRLSAGDASDLEQAIAAGRRWTAAHGGDGAGGDGLPRRTLCHGVVLDVEWDGPEGAHRSGVPPSTTAEAGYVRPRIAIGASSADALAVAIADAESERRPDLTAAARAGYADVLEAFQLGVLPLLEQRDAQAQLRLQMQRAWFGSRDGGTGFELVPPQRKDEPKGHGVTPLGPQESNLLTALNSAQRALDACERELESLRWEAYALWWKGQRFRNALPSPGQPVREAIETATKRVQAALAAQLTRRVALRQARDAALVQLDAVRGELELRPTALPPFFQPNDPVVLVTGAHRSFKHGSDGRFHPDGVLLCRFSGQTVAGLALPEAKAVAAAELGLPSLAGEGLPLELGELLAEAVLLDPTHAPVLALLARPDDARAALASVRKAQTLVWSAAVDPAFDLKTLAETSPVTTLYGFGAWPSKVGVEFWTPPWSPLFLDWSIEVHDDGAGSLSGWTLPAAADGAHALDELAYRSDAQISADVAYTVEGRTLLTPQASDVLAARLQHLVEDHADDPTLATDLWALVDASAYLGTADVLSQSLSGFHMTLLGRSLDVFAAPADGERDGFLPESAPAPDASIVDPTGGTVPLFRPLRVGHARVKTLEVVDGFGQVFDVLDAIHPDSPPLLGPDLATAGDETLVELKPRVIQASRLAFPLLDADDDTREVGIAADANPVCGWLLPNRLDKSLLVYAADGTLEGELLLAAAGAAWLPAPDASPPPGTESSPPIEIENPHLRRLVCGIAERPDSAKALAALLALVDEALWSIDPQGSSPDEELSVLIGKPLAVVRAVLRLELHGRPATATAWDATGEDDTGGLEEVRFPVQLGLTELYDDGLVGYYLNDDYRQIQTAYVPKKPSSYVGAKRPEISFAPTGGALLTLVVAPDAKVHALSGILPPLGISLPARFTAPALGRLEILFRTGPVLGDAAGVALPLPAVQDGAWTWLQYRDPGSVARRAPIGVPDPAARLPDTPPVLREGWLRLDLGGPATCLEYAITPGALLCGPGAPSAASLRVTAHNATRDSVTCERIEVVLDDHLAAAEGGIAASVDRDVTIGTDLGGKRFILEGVTLKPGETLGLTLAGIAPAAPDVAARPADVAVRETTDETRTTMLAVERVLPLPERSR